MNGDGTIQYDVVINTGGLGKQLNDVNNKLGESGKDGSSKFGAKFGAVAGITATVFNKALGTVTSSIGSAVKRVDTLDNSNRVFENMGFSAEQTKKMMDNLETSISGLPTSLDSAVTNVQLLTGATGDLQKSEEIFAALNNGILGFGGSAEQVDNAMVQLSQAFSAGKIDAQTWNSMMNSGLGPTLQAIAKEMGITTTELKSGLSDGTYSVEEFQDSLIAMNKEGGGGMASLQKIAKDATSGIGTGFTNMKTAVTKGLATIIQAIGSENISTFISNIGKAFKTAMEGISTAITFVAENKEIFMPIAVAIGAIAAAMVLWNAAVGIATTVQTIYNAVLAANPLGILLLAIIGVTAALVYFFTQTELGKDVIKNVGEFFGKVIDSIVGFFKSAWETVQNVWNAITDFFTTIFEAVKAVFDFYVNTYVAIFKAAWEAIKFVWGVVVGFFKGIWDGIVKVFSVVGNWFKNVFQRAWDGIKNIFSAVGGFFRGVWDTIKSIFTNIGSSIGDAIGGAFKFVVNSIIGFAEKTINGFIRAINGAIKMINKIPGVNISTIGEMAIPRLAKGGITTGSTLANIGEAGREAVLPLENNTEWMDELADKIGGGPSTVIVKLGEETIATRVIDLINDRTRLSGSNAIMV